jgi:protein-tyrosine kinase
VRYSLNVKETNENVPRPGWKEKVKLEARKVLWFARKWFWLIVLASFIGGAAGLVVSFLQPKLYEADTTLYISSPNHTDYQSVLGDQQAAKAFIRIPQSDSVLTATIQAVGYRNLNPSQLSSMVTVTNNQDTQYVTIAVRNIDPKMAARLDREIAKQSVISFESAANDNGQVKQFLRQELANLENEMKGLEKQLTEAQNQSRLNTPSTSRQAGSINQLNTHLSADRTLYNELLSSYASMSSTQVTVVQDAQLLPNPIDLGKTVAAAIGALVGLITIVGVIIFIEQTDDILRTPDKIRQATGLSTLMTVAYSSAIAKQAPQLNGHCEVTENSHPEVTGDTVTVRFTPAMVKQARLLASSSELTGDIPQESVGLVEIPETLGIENHQDASEVTIRRLKVTKLASETKVGGSVKDKVSNGYQLPEEFLTLGVLLSDEGGQLTSNSSNVGSLLITSPENGDGKTLIASQLALGLARVGVRVVLIDANLHHPAVHNIFKLSNKIGLSSLLTNSIKVETGSTFNDFLQKTHEPNLAILPGGPRIGSPSELLSSSRMTKILNLLNKEFLVIVDSPSILPSSDLVILAKKCERVLIVVNARHTAATRLNRSLEILTLVNRNILGVILNRTDS